MSIEIIILDQVAALRREFTNVMAEYGIEVAEASNSRELFHNLMVNEIKLIVIETSLINEDGYDIIKKIKANSSYKDIPLIILSSKNTRQDILKGITYGAVDYVVKPYNREIISTRILKYVKPHGTELPKELYYNVFQMDFQKFMEMQFSMCSSGKYPLCFLISNIYINGEDEISLSNEVKFNILLRAKKEASIILRRTDFVFTYGTDNLITVVPFCPVEDCKIVVEKINAAFMQKVAIKYSQIDLKIVTEYATYPEDGNSKDEIINSLLAKLEKSRN